jgi:hypothetical protein
VREGAMRGWLTQVELHQGQSRLVCWLESDPRLKIGAQVKLIGVEGWWRVAARYSRSYLGTINRGWKVGGLK